MDSRSDCEIQTIASVAPGDVRRPTILSAPVAPAGAGTDPIPHRRLLERLTCGLAGLRWLQHGMTLLQSSEQLVIQTVHPFLPVLGQWRDRARRRPMGP